jgi:hypothetical protein
VLREIAEARGTWSWERPGRVREGHMSRDQSKARLSRSVSRRSILSGGAARPAAIQR